MQEDHQDLIRLTVNRFIFTNGVAPSVDDLAEGLGISKEKIKDGLLQLANNHAIVLHPNSFNIWVAHPFALFPTLFWVESAKAKWWGNCTWCSLGIAALCKENVKIHTKIQGESEPQEINVIDGKVQEDHLLVHFPVPAKRFWDNVLFTCSTMLVFDHEEKIDEWCSRHQIPKGEVLPIEQVWLLARLWYGNYLDDGWRRKTPEMAQEIFRKVGLTSNFWSVV